MWNVESSINIMPKDKKSYRPDSAEQRRNCLNRSVAGSTRKNLNSTSNLDYSGGLHCPVSRTMVHHEQREPTGCTTGGVVTFSFGLVAGTFSVVVCKMLYDTPSVGLDGIEKPFSKPIMMLLLMFSGEPINLLKGNRSSII